MNNNHYPECISHTFKNGGGCVCNVVSEARSMAIRQAKSAIGGWFIRMNNEGFPDISRWSVANMLEYIDSIVFADFDKIVSKLDNYYTIVESNEGYW